MNSGGSISQRLGEAENGAKAFPSPLPLTPGDHDPYG